MIFQCLFILFLQIKLFVFFFFYFCGFWFGFIPQLLTKFQPATIYFGLIVSSAAGLRDGKGPSASHTDMQTTNLLLR